MEPIGEDQDFPITPEQALEVVRVTTEVKKGTRFSWQLIVDSW